MGSRAQVKKLALEKNISSLTLGSDGRKKYWMNIPVSRYSGGN